MDRSLTAPSRRLAVGRYATTKASYLIAAAALAAAACFLPAAAADYGPSRAIAAIHHDLPVLLAARVGTATVEAAFVESDEALAVWQAASARGTCVLRYRSGRWWLSPEPAGAAFAERARARIGNFPEPQPPAAIAHAPGALLNDDGGYDVQFRAPESALSLVLHGRAPTAAEMPPSPGENSLYFFDVTSSASPTPSIAGATLDVWFPFVLDASQRYALWLGFVTPEMRELPGTLRDNTLHFVLPPFALAPSKTALGEIDVLP
jgi:hypothetical protein